MSEELKLTVILPASPKDIFDAWLDSQKHSDMTGSEATVDARIDGRFNAWERYIEGTTIEMEPNQRIVQKWRTTDFSENDPDSMIELTLEEVESGTRITLVHSEIPPGQSEDYRKGWDEFYFSPMKSYFEKS